MGCGGRVVTSGQFHNRREKEEGCVDSSLVGGVDLTRLRGHKGIEGNSKRKTKRIIERQLPTVGRQKGTIAELPKSRPEPSIYDRLCHIYTEKRTRTSGLPHAYRSRQKAPSQPMQQLQQQPTLPGGKPPPLVRLPFSPTRQPAKRRTDGQQPSRPRQGGRGPVSGRKDRYRGCPFFFLFPFHHPSVTLQVSHGPVLQYLGR